MKKKEKVKCKTLDEFLKNEGKNVTNILIGNGFALDHPILGDLFKFKPCDIPSLLGKISLYTGKREAGKLRKCTCPEEMVRILKHVISREVALHYIEALEKKLKKESKSKKDDFKIFNVFKKLGYKLPKSFWKIKKIFTLNYDPLLYFASLDQKTFLTDGLMGDYPLSQSEVIDRLNSNKEQQSKVYYLHGSFFVLQNKVTNKFRKLDPNDIKAENILHDKNSDSNEFPALILEPNWKAKKGLIESHEYLSFCKNEFINHKDSGDLLITGVSFDKDAHILYYLLQKAERMADRKIYITFTKNKDNDDNMSSKHNPKSLLKRLIIEQLKNFYTVTKKISEKEFNHKVENLVQKIEPIEIDINSDSPKGFIWKKK